MATYIARRLLDAGKRGYIQPGARTCLEWLDEKQIAKLMQRGAIRRIQAPPLAELKGWSRRAEKLSVLEIVTTEDFLDADPEWVAKEMRVKLETVQRWTREIEAWMTVSPPTRRR